MYFFRRMSPTRAYRDLRDFLARRQAYELWFLAASMAITVFLIWAFAKDSYAKPAYKENLIYVQQWPANRTEAQVLAQQKVDAVAKAKQDAELKKQQDAVRAQYQRLDNQLTAWGF